jgi:peptidyl-prolyl cis-trans isomerase C
MRPMRASASLSILLVAGMLALAGPARAQTTPQTTPQTDPVVARVDGQDIHLSEITDAALGLPDQYRNMPKEQLFPLLVDQAVDKRALLVMAKKEGIDKDPVVQRQMILAGEQVQQNAVMSKSISPLVTEDALRARYETDIAGKTGEEEVHARHILVASEADANKIIAELKKGADFATLAKSRSTDPGASQGGDLGYFKKGDMLPEFANAAFALKPGQFSDKPVKTQYGWHVIKVEDRRAAPPPTFDQVHDELRQKVIDGAVQKTLLDARKLVKIERFNSDGSPIQATDSAVPPPAPPAAPKP